MPYSKLDDSQGLNLYEYVGNNPLSRADADGHCDPNGGNCSVWDHIAGVVGGALNIVPQTINAVGQFQNAIMAPFTSYRVDMVPEIQVDTHASQGGIDLGNAAVIAAPIAGEAAALKTAGTAAGAVETTSAAGATSKVFSAEKQALVDMAKTDKRLGMSSADMQAYKDLNKTLPDPFPANKVRGPESHPSGLPSSQQPHGHVGPVDHIPIKDKTP